MSSDTQSEGPDCKYKEKKGPVGSGYFSACIGLIYLILGAVLFKENQWWKALDKTYILAFWLICSGFIAISWGVSRVCTGNGGDKRIGMDTINMLVAMLGVAFAVAALTNQAENPKTQMGVQSKER